MDVSRDIEAQFVYWASSRTPEPSEGGDLFFGNHPDLGRHTAKVHDLRALSERFNATDHGFQVIKHASAFLPTTASSLDFTDPEQVGLKYWPELGDVVKQELGAQLVIPFNSAVRESSSTSTGTGNDKEGDTPKRDGESSPTLPPPPSKTSKPISFVHNDIAPLGARNYLRSLDNSFFEEIGSRDVETARKDAFFKLREDISRAEDKAMKEADCDLLSWDGCNYHGPRWGLFSVWRPLETVKQDPLGMMDASSIFPVPSTYSEKHKTYVSIPFRAPGKEGSEGYLAPNILPLIPERGQQHKWYWTKEQEPDEVYAIKLFDSEAWRTDSRVIPCCPHSAFVLPNASDQPSRRSIETRCLVFW